MTVAILLRNTMVALNRQRALYSATYGGRQLAAEETRIVQLAADIGCEPSQRGPLRPAIGPVEQLDRVHDRHAARRRRSG